PSSPRSTRPLGRTGRSLIRSAGMPRVSARFGLVSPSMARTLWPSRAISLARVPEIEVFPEPPFPAIASFIRPSSLGARCSHRGYRPLSAGRPGTPGGSDPRREPGGRPRAVAGGAVIDVGHRGAHPHGQGLQLELRRPWVDPDQTPRLKLQPPRLPGQRPRVAPVPAVAEHDHDRASGETPAPPHPVELLESRPDASPTR